MNEPGSCDWNQIVERHGERVFRAAYRILGSVPDAEDAAQDVFVDALRRRSVEPVRNWTAFLVRLATLRSIDRIRRRQPSFELRETDSVSNVEPAAEMTATELADWLREHFVWMMDFGLGGVRASPRPGPNLHRCVQFRQANELSRVGLRP